MRRAGSPTDRRRPVAVVLCRSLSRSVGPAINLMVWRAGGGAIVVTLGPPPSARANYDCWFLLLVSWGLVWSRRRIVALARRDSATMAINETRWNDGRKEVGKGEGELVDPRGKR